MRHLILVCLAIFVTGCASSTPACGDQESLDLVLRIVDQEYRKFLGAEVDKLNFSLDLVTMTERDTEVDSYTCSAQLTVEGPRGSKSGNIAYDIRSSATDAGQFVIQVYGATEVLARP